MSGQKDINELAMQQANQLYEEAFGRAKQLEEKAAKWASERYAQAKVGAEGFYAKAQEYYAGEDGELEALEKENLERMKMIANRFRIVAARKAQGDTADKWETLMKEVHDASKEMQANRNLVEKWVREDEKQREDTSEAIVSCETNMQSLRREWLQHSKIQNQGNTETKEQVEDLRREVAAMEKGRKKLVDQYATMQGQLKKLQYGKASDKGVQPDDTQRTIFA